MRLPAESRSAASSRPIGPVLRNACCVLSINILGVGTEIDAQTQHRPLMLDVMILMMDLMQGSLGTLALIGDVSSNC